jgi:hypothetical protein
VGVAERRLLCDYRARGRAGGGEIPDREQQ